MKEILYPTLAIIIFAACSQSHSTYSIRYIKDGCEYGYSIDYPSGIREVTAAKYAALDMANDYDAIITLMDSLINRNIPLDFWCHNYYHAMKEVMPYHRILPRLLKLHTHEPNNPAVYSAIGYTYTRLGYIRHAVDYFTDGLKLAPENSNLWYGLGIATLQTGDTLSAVIDLKKSFEFAEKYNIETQIRLSRSKLEQLEK